jgi:hypothetical protein
MFDIFVDVKQHDLPHYYAPTFWLKNKKALLENFF